MSYHPSRLPRRILATLAVSLLVIWITNPFWEPAKQGYFHFVVTSCGIEELEWEEILAFDASHKRWTARNAADLGKLHCIQRWAGIIIRDKTPEGVFAEMEGYPAIEVVHSGWNYAPAQNLQSRSFIEVRN